MNLKLSEGVCKIQREIWKSRLLEVIADRRLATYEIVYALQVFMGDEHCISEYTIIKYLREMVKDGSVQTENKRVRGNMYRRFYWRENYNA